MAESFSKNFIDYEEYPQTADIQAKCVNMVAKLFKYASSARARGTLSL